MRETTLGIYIHYSCHVAAWIILMQIFWYAKSHPLHQSYPINTWLVADTFIAINRENEISYSMMYSVISFD